MHLLLPFSAAPAAAPAEAAARRALRLPNLQRGLSLLQPTVRHEGETSSLNLPHEHALAVLNGWPDVDGLLPFAAAQAAQAGLAAGGDAAAWGLLTPTHWQLGREQINLLDPAQLHLDESESRGLLQAVRELFESLGWALHWVEPLRWYASHEALAELPTASLDRVIGQPIDGWLPARKAGAAVRRLQSEVQMLLHEHPINEAREARGDLPVNAFWLSGTGRARPITADVTVDMRLREPWLARDWAAWAEAWRLLDAQALADLAQRAERGEAVALTLCGESAAQRFEAAPRSGWHKLTRLWRHGDMLHWLDEL